MDELTDLLFGSDADQLIGALQSTIDENVAGEADSIADITSKIDESLEGNVRDEIAAETQDNSKEIPGPVSEENVTNGEHKEVEEGSEKELESEVLFEDINIDEDGDGDDPENEANGLEENEGDMLDVVHQTEEDDPEEQSGQSEEEPNSERSDEERSHSVDAEVEEGDDHEREENDDRECDDEKESESEGSEKSDEEEEEIERPPTKKRRRIIVQSDEDDDQEEVDHESELSSAKVSSAAGSSEDTTSNDDDCLPITFESSQLIENERPKPRCFKESTRIIKQMEARALLQAAVIIPAPKKTKSRAIESDDEIDQQPVAESDDIGLVGDDHDVRGLRFLPENLATSDDEREHRRRRKKEAKRRRREREREEAEKKRASTAIKSESKPTIKLKSLDELKEPSQEKVRDRFASSSSDEFIPNDVYFGEAPASQQRRKSTTSKSSRHNKRSQGTNNDRSRSGSKKKKTIPNHIYFGDVPCSMRELLTYDDSDDDIQPQRLPPAKPYKHHSKSTTKRPTATTTAPSNSFTGEQSTSRDKLSEMKDMFWAAGLWRITTLKQLFIGCSSNNQRCDRILNFLIEKGMEGEPNLYNAKELGKRLQAEREIKELDTSLIISPDGRSTRRTTRLTAQEQSNCDPAGLNDVPAAIKKAIQIVDTDSE